MNSILVVDDDASVLSLICAFIQLSHHHALQAGNAEEALRVVEKGSHLDAMISDIQMPGMNGINLGLAVRKLKPDLPILFLSGYADFYAKETVTFLRSEKVYFLNKPFTRDQFGLYLAVLLDCDGHAHPGS